MGQPNPQTTLVWCMRCGLITLLCGALFSRLSAVNFNAVSRHRRDFVVSPASDGGVWYDVRQETGSFRSRASRKHDVSNQHWRKQLRMEHSSLLTATRPCCDGHSTTCFRLRRYGDLTVFRMAAIRHLWFLKYIFSRWLRDPCCIIVPIFVKIGQSVAEISWFCDVNNTDLWQTQTDTWP